MRRNGPGRTESDQPEEGAAPEEVAGAPIRRVVLDPRGVWRAGLVVIALVALTALARFVLSAGANVLVTIGMAWIASLAMEPAVRRLSARMPRGRAALLVMGAAALFMAGFLAAFGTMLVQQIAQLIRQLPNLVTTVIDWGNRRFGTDYSVNDILTSLNLTPGDAAGYANTVLGGVLGVLGSVVGALVAALTWLMLTYYFSADGPRLRLWIARLLPGKVQEVFATVWDLTTLKTGGYVAARVVLAGINGGLSTLVFLAVGLPSWLALGIWTGLVAQFVPAIGTYISIALPVLVGLMSDRPWTGLAVLGWAVLYQQVENLTIEPRISARAVNVHPAVSFSSVLLGSALFGISGALLSIPIVAMLLSLLDIYAKRHELVPQLAAEQAQVKARDAADG